MGIEGKQSRGMAPYELAQTSAPGNGRAVVLGGGLAGLLAARVLADWFEEVMIIERHNSPVARQVLPQVLSDAARTQLDQLFTGLSSELVAHGAANAVPASRPNLTTASTPRTKRADARLQFTQRFVHRHLSRRLDSFDGVMMQDGCDAVGLASGRGRRISVHVLPRSHSAAARTIPAARLEDGSVQAPLGHPYPAPVPNRRSRRPHCRRRNSACHQFGSRPRAHGRSPSG